MFLNVKNIYKYILVIINNQMINVFDALLRNKSNLGSEKSCRLMLLVRTKDDSVVALNQKTILLNNIMQIMYK